MQDDNTRYIFFFFKEKTVFRLIKPALLGSNGKFTLEGFVSGKRFHCYSESYEI